MLTFDLHPEFNADVSMIAKVIVLTGKRNFMEIAKIILHQKYYYL